MENEQRQAVVKLAETRLPKFVESAYESVEQMQQFARILLESKLVPSHFYEQLPDKKPDFTKGKIPAVVAVLIQGYQLQLPPLTALQHIIPVNGLLSIKGDLAKSMIFNSGKLKPGSWKEEETGSIEEGNMVVSITATRTDNGQTLTRSFSVAQAKRAGLWVTEQQVSGQDGWKYKASAWWKYPSRMLNYRALGFLARDMFPDVMAGIYTTEEAMDMPRDSTETIVTEAGATIIIPDKEHSKQRSDKLTKRAVESIPDNKFSKVEDVTPVQEEVPPVTFTIMQPTVKNESHPPEGESSFIPSKGSVEYQDGKIIRKDGEIVEQKSDNPGDLTLEVMEKMETPELLKLINGDIDMMEAMEIIPGKNTNKKLREIIYAHQRGRLAEHVAPHLTQENEGNQANPNVDKETGEIKERNIEPNKEFDKKEEPVKTAGNKYNLVIPDFDKGDSREFSTMKAVFNLLASVDPPVNNPRYLILAGKMGILQAFPDRETFCKNATVKIINELLDSN